MDTSSILNTLTTISGNGTETAEIAQDAIKITNQFQAGQLSQSEYQELIGDLQIEKLVALQASRLELKEELDRLFSAILADVNIVRSYI